jgi:hypothetical protein
MSILPSFGVAGLGEDVDDAVGAALESGLANVFDPELEGFPLTPAGTVPKLFTASGLTGVAEEWMGGLGTGSFSKGPSMEPNVTVSEGERSLAAERDCVWQTGLTRLASPHIYLIIWTDTDALWSKRTAFKGTTALACMSGIGWICWSRRLSSGRWCCGAIWGALCPG